MQLMQQKVQKSRTTILPFRSATLIGPAELSQAMPPSSSGAFWRSSRGWSLSCPAAMAMGVTKGRLAKYVETATAMMADRTRAAGRRAGDGAGGAWRFSGGPGRAAAETGVGVG